VSPIARYALRLGDDALILGQRLGEWTGHAPTLELDLALANFALDLIGQATYLLGQAGAEEGEGRDGDSLAFHRDVFDFCNCLMVEQPNGDFARTIARQFLFSTYQHGLYQALTASTDAALAALAKKAEKETAYHARFAQDWVVRLGDATPESAARMAEGLAWHWRFIDELFLMDAMEQELSAAGVAADKAALRPAFDARVAEVLAEAKVQAPAAHRPVSGGRKGNHSEHLGHLLAQMQFLPRAYPGAVW
jgi:ring-1,2-phenylacetyl-CoA epoxidase subunit PaaC